MAALPKLAEFSETERNNHADSHCYCPDRLALFAGHLWLPEPQQPCRNGKQGDDCTEGYTNQFTLELPVHRNHSLALGFRDVTPIQNVGEQLTTFAQTL